MKKFIVGLAFAGIVLALAIVFHIFRHETAYVGKYTVVYQINQCNIPPEALPQDLYSLMNLPCVIRITWQDEIADRMFQEYCYLPGRGIEKGSIYQKK
jgi:hypothetical protein